MKISNELLSEVLASHEAEELKGFCLACGQTDPHMVYPDARELECEHCGESQVFGTSSILVMAANAIVRRMHEVAGQEAA